MAKISTDKRIKELKNVASIERKASKYLKRLNQIDAQEMAINLEKSSLEKLELAENLTIQWRLDALSIYSMEMRKSVRKGESKTYTYWYASWRVNKKVKNFYIGPANKMSREEALAKARKLKAKDLELAYKKIYFYNIFAIDCLWQIVHQTIME